MRPFAACLLVLASCVEPMDTNHRAGRSARVTGDCLVRAPAGLMAPGAPASVELGAGSLWMWSEPALTGGGSAPNAAALVTSVDAACAGSFAEVVVPIVPLLPAEAQGNASRTDGKRTVPVPRGGFAAGARVYVYYDLVVRGPGLFDEAWVGTGVCQMDSLAAPCARDDRLLWSGRARSWAASGYVGDDGLAYLMACAHAAESTDLCGLARVPPASAADAGAYRYFSPTAGWIDDPDNYGVVFSGPTSATLGRGPDGGLWAVSPDIWSSTIEARAATAPGAAFGPAFVLVAARPPKGWFIGGGAWHKSLDPPGALTVSYSNDDGVHLVTASIE
jgi:hypothetical protein